MTVNKEQESQSRWKLDIEAFSFNHYCCGKEI